MSATGIIRKATTSSRLDGSIALLLFMAATTYVANLPYNLGAADESYFLYEAKRIIDGEVLYRDVFLYVTPLSAYFMAALYWFFGATMTTARVATAVLHGLIVAIAYNCARALGVRRLLAAAAALAHIALAQTAWPFASMHWFSSALAGAALLILLRSDVAAAPRRLFGLGALCGVFIGVQQQRGVVPTLAVGAFLLLDHLVGRWYGAPLSWRTAAVRLATFFAGVAAVVMPMLLIFINLAGVEPVYEALVRWPLESYRSSAPRVSWGLVTPLTAGFAADTFPRLLRLLPLALLPPGARLLINVARRRGRTLVRQLTALVLLASAGVLSIWYNNDFIHIGFIVAALVVCLAAAVQWILDSIPGAAVVAQGTGWVLAAAALLGIGQHLSAHMARKWQQYPHAHQTVFGRVDFATKWEPVLMDATREALKTSASQEIFCYPNLTAPYLMTGGKNPTPFQHFDAHVFPPRDTARVIATLRERRVPFLVISYAYIRRDDPIAQLMNAEYEAVPIPALPLTGEFPTTLLYRRKAVPMPASP